MLGTKKSVTRSGGVLQEVDDILPLFRYLE